MITQSNWLRSTEGEAVRVEYDGSCYKKKNKKTRTWRRNASTLLKKTSISPKGIDIIQTVE